MTSYVYLPLSGKEELECAEVLVPSKLSYEEIARHARRFSTSIFRDWVRLNAILKRFEDTIQKRWLKKTVKQRREILLKAWPNMNEHHRPDFDSFRMTKPLDKSSSARAAAYLWPYINLEDLSDRTNLLLFLHSRGRALPDGFVRTDIWFAHLGPSWYAVAEAPEQYTMELDNCRTPLTYGKLVVSMERAVVQHLNGVAFGFSAHRAVKKPVRPVVFNAPMCGLLVLEIQQGIYSFLLSCAQSILHDIDPVQYNLAPHQPALRTPDFCTSKWSSLLKHMTQSPYRVPENFDMEQFILLVDAQRLCAEDHVWTLRENPGYFIDCIKEIEDSCPIDIASANNSPWEFIIGITLVNGLKALNRWSRISDLLHTLPPIDIQLRDANKYSLRLNADVETTWVRMHELLLCMRACAFKEVCNRFAESPTLRHSTYRDEDGNVHVSTSHLELRSNAEHRVLSLFGSLCEQELCGFSSAGKLIQEIQHMLETDVEASTLVDKTMLNPFADLAMSSELCDRLANFYPWYIGWLGVVQIDPVPTADYVARFFDTETTLLLAIAEAGGSRAFSSFCGVHSQCWVYPESKKRTQKNVQQMRRAEYCLDRIWNDLEDMCHAQNDICLTGVLTDMLMKPRKLHRTQEWIGLSEQLPKPADKAMLKEVNPNIPRFPCDQRSSKFHSAPKPRKTKTRGIPGPLPQDGKRHEPLLLVTHEAKPDTPALAKVKVPKRAYRVLSALFPTGGAENHQNTELEWTALLQGLDAIGLRPVKLYGSVWLFKPKAKEECLVEMSRSIQFHAPHGSKIPAGMIRTFGRRLKHAFGWEDGMFVPA